MREIGKALIVAGVILLPITTFYIGYTITPTGIPTPIGVAGFVFLPNGTILMEKVTVYAENLNTKEIVSRETQNGKFAIPISARDNDRIKVWTEYRELKASKIIVVDMHKTTHWANLTLGKEEHEPMPPYWLLLIPLGMIGVGYAIERRKR